MAGDPYDDWLQKLLREPAFPPPPPFLMHPKAYSQLVRVCGGPMKDSLFIRALDAEIEACRRAQERSDTRSLWGHVSSGYRGAGRRWGHSQRARARRWKSWVARREAAHLPLKLNKATQDVVLIRIRQWASMQSRAPGSSGVEVTRV